MQNKKGSKGEIIIACILAFLIILVVVASVLVFIKYSPVKGSNKGGQASSQTEAKVLEEETYHPEEIKTEMAFDGFSVGSVPPIPEKKEEAEEELEEDNGDYVIADSNSRFLTQTDLEELTKEELAHARNEIYARHGRMFDSEELKEYFGNKEWYTPLYTADSFPEDELNEFEKKNANFISQYEKENN